MKRKSWLLRILIVAAVLVLLVVAWLGTEVYASFANIVLPWHRQNAIDCACDWGGLASLPDSATGLSVKTSGSEFTRTFDVEFTASGAEIEKWVSESPSLRDGKPERLSGDRVKYSIYPGEKRAAGGWVEIDGAGHRVFIHVSWS
jgi:hypothetical protein